MKFLTAVLLTLPVVASATDVAAKGATTAKKAQSLRNLQRFPRPKGDYYEDPIDEEGDDGIETKLDLGPTEAPSSGKIDDDSCEEGYSLFELELTLDAYPFETHWEVISTCDWNLLAWGGDYSKDDVNKVITEKLCLEDAQGVSFTIYDHNYEDGDGLCCDNILPGNYSLSYAGETVFSGGEFGWSETTEIAECTATRSPTFAPTDRPTWARRTPAPTPEPTQLVCPIGHEKVKECVEVTRAPWPTPSPTTAAPTGDNGCPKGEAKVELHLTLDDWPTETYVYGYAYVYKYMCYNYTRWDYWKQESYEYEYCYWGSEYLNYFDLYGFRKDQKGAKIYNSTCVPHGYTFQLYINDGYGDGICCDHGEGSYTVSIDGEVYKSGGDFGWGDNLFVEIGDIVEPYEDDEYMYPEYFRKDNPKQGDIIGNLNGVDMSEEAPPTEMTEEQLESMKPVTGFKLPPGVTPPNEKGRRLLSYKK